MSDNIQSEDKINIEEYGKAFRKLNLIDNALFMAVMDTEDALKFCKIIIETVLGRKVRIEKVYAEKTIPGIDTDRHGIRMDALVVEIREAAAAPSKNKESGTSPTDSRPSKPIVRIQKKTVYDIEPDKNEKYRHALPRRTRYYTSLSDAQALRSGATYDSLPDTVIIMILSYDPFGIGDMRYEGKTTLTTHPTYPYDDGIRRIYLYVDGKYDPNNAREKEVHELLKYMKETTAENAKSGSLSTINEIVEAIKSLPPGALLSYYKQMEREYMFNEQLRELDEQRQELDEQRQELDRAKKLIAEQKALIDKLQKQNEAI